MVIVWIFAVLLILYLVLLLLLRCRKGNETWAKLKPQRYAHRGYHDKPTIPENSMPAFRRAIEHGWGAELDVHLLRDGTLAVFHDSDLKRCANVEGEQPLIIELKTAKGNHRALAEAVCRRLDSYTGDFCIESFDPFAVADVRKLRPGICRGQLSMNFLKEPSGLPWYQRFLMTNVLLNWYTQPDFLAYQFSDRDNFCLDLARRVWGVQEVSWTIRSKEDLLACEKFGSIGIFEKFDPEQ